MAVEYRSTERVYELDAHGQPFALRYAVGDVIPLEEARRQGLVEDPVEAKAVAGPPQDKARRPRATKARTPEEG